MACKLQWNPDFSNFQGKRKLARKIGEFEKSGVKLQCSTEEGKQLLVRVIGRFEKNESSRNRDSTVVNILTVR